MLDPQLNPPFIDEHSSADRLGAFPERAQLIGYLGLLPFAISTLAVWALSTNLALLENFLYLNLYYSAVIVSFLAGIQWGFALIMGTHSGHSSDAIGRLTWSVGPCLLAWIAIAPSSLVPLYGASGNTNVLLRYGLTIIAFVWVLTGDFSGKWRGFIPEWYSRLRMMLSLFVVGMLALVMIKVWLIRVAAY